MQLFNSWFSPTPVIPSIHPKPVEILKGVPLPTALLTFNSTIQVTDKTGLASRIRSFPLLKEYLVKFPEGKHPAIATAIFTLLKAIHNDNSVPDASVQLNYLLKKRSVQTDYSILVPFFCSALLSKNQATFLPFITKCLNWVESQTDRNQILDICLLKMMDTKEVALFPLAEEAIIFLLNQGADMNVSTHSNDEIAGMKERNPASFFLSDDQASTDLMNSIGAKGRKMNLFHFAVWRDFTRLTEFLIKKEYQLSRLDGWCPQHRMILSNNLKGLLGSFLKTYNNIDQVDFQGNTLLHIAMTMNLKQIALFLIENGANVDVINSSKQTVLHVDKVCDVELLHIILEKMNVANHSYLDVYGNSCIHRHISNQDYITKILTKIDPNIRNIQGIPAVFFQVTSQSLLAFSQAGADLDLCDPQGKNIYHYPRTCEAMEDLLYVGVDPKRLDNNGRSAIGSIYHSNVSHDHAKSLIIILRKAGVPIDDQTIVDAMLDFVKNQRNRCLELFAIDPSVLDKAIPMRIPGSAGPGGRSEEVITNTTLTLAVYNYFPTKMTELLNLFYGKVRRHLVDHFVAQTKSGASRLFFERLYRTLEQNPDSEYFITLLVEVTNELNKEGGKDVDLRPLYTIIENENANNVTPKKSLLNLAIDLGIERVRDEILKKIPIRKNLIDHLIEVFKRDRKDLDVKRENLRKLQLKPPEDLLDDNGEPFDPILNETRLCKDMEERLKVLCHVILSCMETHIGLFRRSKEDFLERMGDELALFEVLVKTEEWMRESKIPQYSERDHEYLWAHSIKKSIEKTVMLLKSALPTQIKEQGQVVIGHAPEIFDWGLDIESDAIIGALAARTRPTKIDFSPCEQKQMFKMVIERQWSKLALLMKYNINLPADQFVKLITQEDNFGGATWLLEAGYKFPMNHVGVKHIFNHTLQIEDVDDEEIVFFLRVFFKDYPFILELISITLALNEPIVSLKGHLESALLRAKTKEPGSSDGVSCNDLTLLDIPRAFVDEMSDFDLCLGLEKLLDSKRLSENDLIQTFSKLRPEHMTESMVSLNEPKIVIPYPEVKQRFGIIKDELMRSLDSLLHRIDTNTLPNFDPRYTDAPLKHDADKINQLEPKKLFLSILDLIRNYKDRVKAINAFIQMAQPCNHNKADLFKLYCNLQDQDPLVQINFRLTFAEAIKYLNEMSNQAFNRLLRLIDLSESNQLQKGNSESERLFYSNGGMIPRFDTFFKITNFREVLQDILLMIEGCHPAKRIELLMHLMNPSNANLFGLHAIKMNNLIIIYKQLIEMSFDSRNPNCLRIDEVVLDEDIRFYGANDLLDVDKIYCNDEHRLKEDQQRIQGEEQVLKKNLEEATVEEDKEKIQGELSVCENALKSIEDKLAEISKLKQLNRKLIIPIKEREFRKKIDSFFNCIRDRERHMVAADNGTSESELYYSRIELNLTDILKKLFKNMSPQRLHHCVSTIAKAAFACESRWAADIVGCMHWLADVKVDPKDKVLDYLRAERKNIIMKVPNIMGEQDGNDSHNYIRVMQNIGKELGFEEAEALKGIKERFSALPHQTREKLAEFFYPRYGLDVQISLIASLTSFGEGRDILTAGINKDWCPQEFKHIEDPGARFKAFAEALMFTEDFQYRRAFFWYVMFKTGILGRV